MIDLHTHILPGLDDGASTLDDSLALARLAVADGITHMAATPHGPGIDLSKTIARRQEALHALKAALAQEAIPLTVIPGLEYCSDGNAIDNVIRHPECFLGYPSAANSRYLLLEIPPQISLGFISHQLFKAQLQNINLILAHPERHQEFSKNIRLLKELMDKGLILQFNADSFTGGFFSRLPRRQMTVLIRHNPDHVIIASDAHDPDWRPPVLSCARKPICSALGDDAWNQVTRQNPARILGIN